MHGCYYKGSEGRSDQLSALTRDAEGSTQEGLRRSRTKADQNLRLHHAQFSVEPGTTGVNFRVARLLVNPLLAAGGSRPLKVLHHVGQINLRVINTSLFQCPIEKFSRRSNKRMPKAILLIAGLLADKHDW